MGKIQRRLFRFFIAGILGVALAMTQFVAAEASPIPGTVSLTLNSFGRDPIYGTVVVDANVTSAGWNTANCLTWTDCSVVVAYLTTSGANVTIASQHGVAHDGAQTDHLTGIKPVYENVTAVRAGYGSWCGGTITWTPWVSVADSYLTPKQVSFSLTSLYRDPATGYVNYSAQISSTNFTGGNCGGTDCYAVLAYQDSSGTVANLGYVSGTQHYTPMTNTVQGVKSFANTTVERVRAGYGSWNSGSMTWTDWIGVDDWLPTPNGIAVTVNSFSANGYMATFDVTATTVNLQMSTCSASYCYLFMDYERPDGSWAQLKTALLPRTYASVTTVLTGSHSVTDTPVAIRVGWGPSNGQGIAWSTTQPVSVDVQGGHDLAALTVALGSGLNFMEFCLRLAQLRAPGEISTVSALGAACINAIETTPTITAAQLLAVLVAGAGTAVLSRVAYALSDELAPPPTVEPGEIAPTPYPMPNPASGGKTAPPTTWIDPTQQSNVASSIALSGRVTWGQFAPLANPQQVADQVATACLRLTVARSLDPNLCKTTPIYAPGSDVAEAAQHDFEAMINSTHPEPILLEYRSGAERLGEGVSRAWYESEPDISSICPTPRPTGTQCDEYPFYASSSSGPAGASGRPPYRASLKLIAEGDNMREGLQYGAVAQVCGVASEPITGNRQILIVPMAFEGAPPSSAWCNS